MLQKELKVPVRKSVVPNRHADQRKEDYKDGCKTALQTATANPDKHFIKERGL